MMETKHHKRQLIIFSALAMLSILFGIFDSSFILGITFNFASVFYLIITALFGLRFALPTVLFIHFITVFLFNEPLWAIIPILEVIIVAFLFKKTRRLNLFLCELLFWLIGGPLAFFLYNHFAPSQMSDMLIPFLIVISITNGLFNALIADILITYLPFKKWMRLESHTYLVKLYQILFHLVIVAVVLPFLINVGLNTNNIYERSQSTSQQIAKTSATSIEDELENWSEDDILQLKLKGIIQIGYLNEFIQMHTENNNNPFHIVITDKEQKVLATSISTISANEDFQLEKSSQTNDNQFYENLPNEELKGLTLNNWASGYLTYERHNKLTDVTIYILFPIYYFQEQIFDNFIQQYQFILLFAGGFILIAIIINRLFVRTLSQLSQATTGLPNKLKRMETINWPKSFITELKIVIDNFKHMSNNLKNMFHEVHTINEKLEIQAIELKKSEEELYQFAYYDPLTKLPNRLHFQQYLTGLIAKRDKHEDKLAVLFLDLNRFKQVNDTLGHEAGDTLLQIVSNRLLSLEHADMKVFRLGGDEFVVIINSIDKQSVTEEANRLLSIIKEPILLKDNTLYISASIGVSIFPEDGEDIDTLVKNADMAMYSSKEIGGKEAMFFKKRMEESFTEKMIVDNGLHEALHESQFELYYQPKINASTEQLSGMEALIRWNHPTFGLVSPATFIPIAEELGLIIDIDKWCIRQACIQNKQWQNDGYCKVPVAVNLSAKHFYQSDLITTLKDALIESGLEPQYLKLEITESVFIQNVEHVIEMIHQIKRLGISISIDDFGIGYSSLNHLLTLPIQEVKLDQVFVRDIHINKKKESIVKTIVLLAHDLKLNVVAEGVESINELEILRQFQCNEFQGYFYSKPLTSTEFTRFLKKFS